MSESEDKRNRARADGIVGSEGKHDGGRWRKASGIGKERGDRKGIGNQRAHIVNRRGIGIQRVREQVCMSTFQMTFIIVCENRSGRPATKRLIMSRLSVARREH